MKAKFSSEASPSTLPKRILSIWMPVVCFIPSRVDTYAHESAVSSCAAINLAWPRRARVPKKRRHIYIYIYIYIYVCVCVCACVCVYIYIYKYSK